MIQRAVRQPGEGSGRDQRAPLASAWSACAIGARLSRLFCGPTTRAAIAPGLAPCAFKSTSRLGRAAKTIRSVSDWCGPIMNRDAICLTAKLRR